MADEIVQYYNEEWVSIIDMKQKSLNDLPREMDELAKNNKNEEVVVLIKDEMIPIIDDAIERLEAAKPENRQVKKMNEMQIEAEEFAKDSFKKVITYYEGGDVSENEIDQYNEELQEKYQHVLDFRDKLMDKYSLEQVENEEKSSGLKKMKRSEN